MRPVALLLPLIAVIGCGTIQPPQRTLPERIHTVYLPMPRNESYEYGFEEELARQLHQEFMADGRLRPTRAQMADARLETTIRSLERSVTVLNRDDYPLAEQASMTVDLVLWEAGHSEPTLELPGIHASTTFMSDPRRSQFTPEPEWRSDLLQALAITIVEEVLTAEPEDVIEALETAEQAEILEFNLDQDPNQSVPSIRTAPGR